MWAVEPVVLAGSEVFAKVAVVLALLSSSALSAVHRVALRSMRSAVSSKRDLLILPRTAY